MKLLLRNQQAPGDVLMLTSAVRDLHRAFPGRFSTAVETDHPEIWQFNPLIVSPERLGRVDRVIQCEYPLIHESNERPYHFLHGFVQDLERKLGLSIPVTEYKADVYLSESEMTSPSPLTEAGYRGPYWVVVAGGKHDFTTKWWDPASYQAVVDHFAGRIRFVQCGAKDDWHPPLSNVLNWVGKTTLREFMRVVYWAEGVLCPITFAMHLAAALPARPGSRPLKPCVVVAGGREPPHWEMYPGHQFLHTVGSLNCCAKGGCWKSRCQPIGDGQPHDTNLCVQPVRTSEDLMIGRCMTQITPGQVIKAMEPYLETSLPISSRSRRRKRPNAVAVTIGVGEFEHMAHLAAKEVSRRIGLETVVLGSAHFAASGLKTPTLLKFRLFDLIDAENVLYFDADMVPLEDWDPRSHFDGEQIVAVRDRLVPSICHEADVWGVPAAQYFNAGFFIANRSRHTEWLRLAEQIQFDHPSELGDQSMLNAARQRLNIPLKLLDRRFNWVGFGASSLSLQYPVVLAHKIAPDRCDLNVAYLEGRTKLFGPSIRVDDAETERLHNRVFSMHVRQEEVCALHFREDGTITRLWGDQRDEAYWFVQTVGGRPTLTLASETQILRDFIEAHGGDWIGTNNPKIRLIPRTADKAPLNEETALSRMRDFANQIGIYPSNNFAGRGVVICGGGEKYLPSAWVCVHMLRHLGCNLPIELWHLRRDEVTDEVAAALAKLNVGCVNAAERRQHESLRCLGGWELKAYSILHSRFEKVLFLDADNMPVADPTSLFETPEFSRHGAIFWPDYARTGPDRSIWRLTGVAYREEPEFESGQMVIDKRRCWRALNVAMFLNANSDFYYQYLHGDKDTFRFAWHICGDEYAMVPHPIHTLPATMCQHDFSGRRLFQHRNQDKWSLTRPNRRVADFWGEDLCREFLERLVHVWRPGTA